MSCLACGIAKCPYLIFFLPSPYIHFQYITKSKTTKKIQYFASWALAFFALMATGLSYGTLTDKIKNSGVLAGLVMASLVLVIALLFIGFGSWRHIYGLIIALLTICLCAIFIYLDYIGSEAGASMRFSILRIFASLWVSVVVIRK
jgi:hypothetical protein